ncbi:MAG TPA: DUF2203 domain-containing protein [Candidatus Nitrosotalea sp.]|nr:DUF2203 domain-containing protein [Candidatus Nitrosotalea sp.]
MLTCVIMAQPQTHDVHQANLLLPRVRALVAQISELQDQLPELQDELRIAEYRMRRAQAGESDADGFEQAASSAASAERDLISALDALGQMGVMLKDARTGLVDFLSWREGELIELCWRLGEDQVAHWHRIGEGFSGRRPL